MKTIRMCTLKPVSIAVSFWTIVFLFLASWEGALAQRFPPNPSPQIEIRSSQQVVTVHGIPRRESLSVELKLVSGAIDRADLYILLSIGIGGRDVLALNEQGEYAKRVLPYRSLVEITNSVEWIQLPIFSYLSPGQHSLTALLVRPQGNPFDEEDRLAVASTAFTVAIPDTPPLEIAEQGGTWLSKELFPQPKLYAWQRIYILPYGVGNLYVNYRVPLRRVQRYPIVFLHGEAVTGAGYEATLDAEEGWFTFFLRRGFAVFTTDWPSVGRSAFAGKENHDKLLTNTKIAEDVVELLDRLGPAILVTKSWSGTVGWMVADMRPHLVRGIVALSPRVLGSKLPYRLPLAFNDRGEATEFYPPDSDEINPAGDPDFTGDFLLNAPEVEPRDWIEQLNPGWYDREIGEDGLYTYVNGPGRVPISRGVRDQLQVSLTPVGSEARPTRDVTFSASKIVVIIGEADPMKSLEYGHNLVEALKTAGVSSAEFLALSAENGFPEEGADLEYGENSSRIAGMVFDWMQRQDLAKDVPVRD